MKIKKIADVSMRRIRDFLYEDYFIKFPIVFGNEIKLLFLQNSFLTLNIIRTKHIYHGDNFTFFK